MADLNNYYGNGNSPVAGLLQGIIQGSQLGMQLRKVQNQEEQHKRQNEWAQVQKALEFYKMTKSPTAKKFASQALSKALTDAGMLPPGVNFEDDGSPQAKDFTQTTADAVKLRLAGHIDDAKAQDMVLASLKSAKEEGDVTAPTDVMKYMKENVKTPIGEGLLNQGPMTSQGQLMTLPKTDTAYATPEARQGLTQYMQTPAAKEDIQTGILPQVEAIAPDVAKEYRKENISKPETPSADLKGYAEYSFGGDLKKAQDSLNTPEGQSKYKTYVRDISSLKFENRYPNYMPTAAPGISFDKRHNKWLNPDGTEVPPNTVKEEIGNFAWYKSPNTQRLIRRTESIVAPDGAIDEAIRFAKLVDNPAGTPINKLTGKAKIMFGNSNRQLLNLVQGLSSEEIQQIMGAQGGGERFLEFTQALNDTNLSVEQYVNDAKELKYLIYTRQAANVRGTPEEGKWTKMGEQFKKERPGLETGNKPKTWSELKKAKGY